MYTAWFLRALYNHLCIDVTTMGVSSVFIYVWKRTREGEKQIFFGPLNMPLTQGNTDDDRPHPLHLWENKYHESKLVFTCKHFSWGEKLGNFEPTLYWKKSVSVRSKKWRSVSFAVFVWNCSHHDIVFHLYMNTCVSPQYFDKQHWRDS